jgi:hypothetical protein
VHAALEFAVTYPELTASWHNASSTLVLLAACDELTLGRLRSDAQARGLHVVAFHEPNLDGALTAIAVEPAGHRLLTRLPLALPTSSHREEVTP